MKRTSLIVVIFVLFSLLSMGVSLLPEARAGILYVGGAGSDNYTTIQAAIDDANPGDMVYVYGGIYYENVRINKTLTLIGQDRDITMINANRTGDAVFINANNVNIAGFALTNSTVPRAGIALYYTSNCSIMDVNVSQNFMGIRLQYSNYNTIAFSGVFNNSNGISLEHSDSNMIAFSGVSNYWFGISLSFSDNNTMLNNIAENCTRGIDISLSSDNAIINNRIENGTYAILLSSSVNTTVAGNAMNNSGIYLGGDLQHWISHKIDVSNTVNGKPVHYWRNAAGGSIPSGAGQVILANCTSITVADQNVSNTSVGILLGFSSYNLITNNTASFNTLRGIQLQFSHNNTISGNNVSYNLGEMSDLYSGIRILDSNWNVIENNTASGNGIGINLENSANNSVVGNRVHLNTEQGIALGDSDCNAVISNIAMNSSRGIGVHQSRRNTITDNILSRNAYEGMTIVSSGMSHVYRNVIIFSPIGITLLESANIKMRDNVMIEDSIWMFGYGLEHWNTHSIDASNTVNGKPVYYWKNITGGEIPPSAGEVILANCSRIEVKNQNLSNGTVGMELGFSSNNAISNVTASQNYLRGIFLYSSPRNTLADSHVSHNYLGLYIVRSDFNTLNNNAVSSNYLGIGFVSSRDNTIVNNQVLANQEGIRLDASDRNRVAENTVYSNHEVGIYLEGSDDNQVLNNNVSSGNRFGIHVRISRTNRISRNLVAGNRHGIHVNASSHNVILENIVSDSSEYGIDSDHSYSNEVYHNNIMNNGAQARDDRWDNQWDDDYPSGGNFWSDYSGIDNCSGPNQDICPDPDGIGDIPYVIDADSQDRYPLMSLYEPPTRPPTVHDAVLSGKDFQNVTLKWSLSPDDGAGLRSVVEYRIYRNETYHPDGLGYALVSILPNQTTSFIDGLAGEGNANDYFYVVCAFDNDNLTVCAEGQAGKFTRPITTGPILASIPLIQSDEDIRTVLQTVDYDKAWAYRSSDGMDPWKWHMPFKPYRGDLLSVNHTMGIWINATKDCNLTVAGLVPTRTEIRLSAGWNLVGFPSFNATYTLSDLKADTVAVRVEGYDSLPPHYLRLLGDADVLQAGRGYWLEVTENTIWIVNIR